MLIFGVEEKEKEAVREVWRDGEERMLQRSVEQGVLGSIVKRWEEHGLESQSCHLLALWPWASLLTYVNHSVLICKMGVKYLSHMSFKNMNQNTSVAFHLRKCEIFAMAIAWLHFIPFFPLLIHVCPDIIYMIYFIILNLSFVI